MNPKIEIMFTNCKHHKYVVLFQDDKCHSCKIEKKEKIKEILK